MCLEMCGWGKAYYEPRVLKCVMRGKASIEPCVLICVIGVKQGHAFRKILLAPKKISYGSQVFYMYFLAAPSLAVIPPLSVQY